MNKSDALKLWNKEIGNKEYCYDFAGRKIKRDDYLEKNQVGWVIGFIKPIELGGKDYDGNTIIMHHTTNEEKGNNYPEFETLNKKFIIKYDEVEDFYYIEKIITSDYDESGFI